MTVSVELPEELESFVKEEVESGKYNSKSELLRDAIRLKMVQDSVDTGMIRGETVERLEESLGSVFEGRSYSREEVRERIEE